MNLEQSSPNLPELSAQSHKTQMKYTENEKNECVG